MIRKNRKGKGFTIVELVIVIAVIAILAAVLIPTFASIINKANESADIQAARQMNTALAAESITEKPETFYEVIEILSEAGFNSEKALKPATKHCAFYWYKPKNLIVLANIEEAEATAPVASILILPVSAANDEESPVSILYPFPEDHTEELINDIVDAIMDFLANGHDSNIIFDLESGKEFLNALNSGNITRVEGVTLNTDTLTLDLDTNRQSTLEATINPADATYHKVTWSSSDDSVTVTDEGLVTAVKAGTAIITVTTEDGGYKATCTVTVNHEHSYTAVVTSPTCTKQGYTTYTCSCGDSYVDDYVDALNHTDADNDGDHVCDYGCGKVLEACEDTDKDHVCDNDSACTKYSSGSNAHVDGTPTDGKCEYCGKIADHTCVDGANDGDHVCDYGCGKENVSAHTYSTATCTVPSTCTECGKTTGETLAHTEVIDEAVPPTFTEEGLTEGKHCSVCGKVLVAQETVDALKIGDVLAVSGNYILTEDTVLSNVSIATGVVSTLDLNGKTLTIDSDKIANVVSVNGTLTITNGDVVIACPEEEDAIYECSGIYVGENGNLVIENANITTDRLWNIQNIGTTTITGSVITVKGGYGIRNEGTGTVYINNSTLVADGTGTSQIYCIGGTMEITNTIFKEGDNFESYYYAAPIEASGEGTEVTLDNVTVTTKDHICNIFASKCEVVIKSGTFDAPLWCLSGSTITLRGGTFCGVDFANINETSTRLFNNGVTITPEKTQEGKNVSVTVTY